MQPSEKITPMHRIAGTVGTPLSILSTDVREVNSESTAEASTYDQLQRRILRGEGEERVDGDGGRVMVVGREKEGRWSGEYGTKRGLVGRVTGRAQQPRPHRRRQRG